MPPAEARKGRSVFYQWPMATKSRAKDGVRTGPAKAGRRPPVKVKRRRDIPVLAVAVAGILVVFAIVLIGYVVMNNRPAAGPVSAAGIPCDNLEHTQVHYHTALQIVYQGQVHPIAQNIGIVTDPTTGGVNCYYWLHVHPGNPDVIHIESPASQTFTLGQFFSVWTEWNQLQGQPAERLDATHVSTLTVAPGQTLAVYIDLSDGKGPQAYSGDPKAIVLKPHEVITLEITPPAVTPPPTFDWNSTVNAGL